MKRFLSKFSVLFIFVFLHIFSYAQQKSTGGIKGIMLDAKTRKPIDYVSFAVKNVKDSTVAAMGASTTTGTFTIRALSFGQYKFYAAIIGYKPIIKAFELTAAKPMADLGELVMEESAITLNDVLIKGELLPMIIKRDTIEFSPEAFATQADANVEDVLKVMPGMLVDKDGNITFNGKKIDRVLVEGKDFFGNNPKTATQNLPKEIVSKIQVIERQTDEAIFKGIDDGKRENVINIVLKEDKKKGYFGNVSAGKAGGDLYDAAFNINRFTGKRQFSFISFSNNINRTGFSMSGLNDFFGGDIFSSGLIGGYATDNNGNVTLGFAGENVSSDNGFGGGINDNKGAGINYNDEWGKDKKFPNKIYFNYIFMRNTGIRESITSRLNLLGEDSYFNDRENESNSASSRQRLSMKLDIAIDSTAKLQVVPNLGWSSNRSISSSIFSSYTEQLLQNINEGSSANNNESRIPSFGGRVSFNKRLRKKGRSFSISGSANHNSSSVEENNRSTIIISNNGQPTETVLNQLIDQNGRGNRYSVGADYAEPLGKKVTMSVNYGFSKREDAVVRSVYDYNTGSTRYDLINTDLSRDLQNFEAAHSAGVRLNYNVSPKLYMGIGSTQRYVTLTGNNAVSGSKSENDYLLIQPSVNLSYKITKTASLTLNGGTYANTPTVAQLQSIVDNSNPLFVTTGNPNLKPSSETSLNVSYNQFSPNSGTSFNFSVSGSSTDNRIINNSMLDPNTGIQTTFYDNVDGNYILNTRVGAGFKIKSMGLSISPGLAISIVKNRFFLNREIVGLNGRSFSASANFNYAIGSTLQLSNFISRTKKVMRYGYNSLSDANFTTIYNYFSLTVSLPYDLRFNASSDFLYNANLGISGTNNSVNLVNASFEKLLVKRAMILKATVSDVFNNSRNASRVANEVYILDSVNLQMRRYFLLSLSYRLGKFGEK